MRRDKTLRCVIPLLGLMLLVMLSVLYAVDFKNYYRALATIFGFNAFRYPFLDWEYIGAGIKCWNEGISVYTVDQCDVLGRPFGYSPLWLRLVFIPTDRAWTMPVGIGIILAYLLSLFWLVKPTNWRELIVLALACMSPMVAYGLERGNVDVVIFVILVVAGGLSAGPLPSRILSYALILLAGLLKFYPLVVLVTALRERPRTFFAIAGATGFCTAAFFYRFRDEFAAAWANIPRVGWSAANLPFDTSQYALQLFPGLERLAWFTALPYALMGVLLIVTAIQVTQLFRDGGLSSAFAAMAEPDAMFLVIGAAVILGCFFAGYNKAHRGIHLVFVIAGLVAMQRASDNPTTRTMLTRTTMIVLFLMWDRFFRTALANPDEAPTSEIAMSASMILWFIREVFWWRLAALLLTILVIFGVKSELFAALQHQRHRLQRGYKSSLTDKTGRV
jgi:hypothetical protein